MIIILNNASPMEFTMNKINDFQQAFITATRR